MNTPTDAARLGAALFALGHAYGCVLRIANDLLSAAHAASAEAERLAIGEELDLNRAAAATTDLWQVAEQLEPPLRLLAGVLAEMTKEAEA